uniref:Uncharacterized protein n=1 Tax=Chromera velia CCMP2878 TaxID=1169474 RepID=A0A0G4H0X1_9ALVE|eukprot:Cvel_24189.t1-p1 / transcript=Cvel_24189.t1 / gene=Cvel_24189 / organism=Chromera_velia_CCMP2878 / gene_product=Putative TPR repeat-containing protein R856, putative / transcript_product=Putative TPR repeat-containing protein R856, putative / location=Cvel_scaffold2583:13229-14667(-) / protein_length=439 / sequence_SO=supercontig / SO=protein_coding / is_pseudo=false
MQRWRRLAGRSLSMLNASSLGAPTAETDTLLWGGRTRRTRERPSLSTTTFGTGLLSESDATQNDAEILEFFVDALKEMGGDYRGPRAADALAQFNLSRDGFDYYIFSDKAVRRLKETSSAIPLPILSRLCECFDLLDPARVSLERREALSEFLLDCARAQEQGDGKTKPDDTDRLLSRALCVRAALFQEKGEYDAAMERYAEALNITKRLCSDESAKTASIVHKIGRVYHSKARYEEAIGKYEEALRVKRKVLGDEHVETAATVQQMAAVRHRQERYDEAMQGYEEALRVQYKVFGSEHAETVSTLRRMAMLCQIRGVYEESMRKHLEVLRVRKKVFGDDHAETAYALEGLSLVLSHQGKYEEAMQKIEEALRIQRKVFGDEHPAVASALHNMVGVLLLQGKYEEALPKCREALRVRKKKLGNEHPTTASSTHSMAETL